MNRKTWFSVICLGLALATPACGGSQHGAKDAASADARPVDRIKAQVAGLEGEVDGLFKPIDDLEVALNTIAELPGKLKASGSVELEASAFASVGKSLVAGGAIDLSPLKLEGAANVRADIEAAFASLESALKGLKETDAKVKAIGEKLAGALVEIPKIGVEAQASANVDLANPFASADAKVKAKADIEEVKAIVEEFPNKVKGWQGKLTELPTRVSATMTKAASAFN